MAPNRTTEGRPRKRKDGDRKDRGGDDPKVGTYLVIPYFAGDRGRPGVERPLGANVIDWLCPSIIVNDQPGQNSFRRGDPTRVTVDVGNYGAGTLTAPVYVRVWWSDPTTGFTTLNLFGQATIAAPNGKVTRTGEIVGVIPTTAPAHVCLLANVWSPLDTGASSPTPNPANDRKWAQLNVNDLTVAAGQSLQFMFWAGNSLARDATLEIRGGALSREAQAVFRRLRRTDQPLPEGVELSLRDARQLHDAERRFGERPLHVTLRPGERRPLLLSAAIPRDARPGSTVVIDVTSTSLGDEETRTGAIGVVAHIR